MKKKIKVNYYQVCDALAFHLSSLGVIGLEDVVNIPNIKQDKNGMMEILVVNNRKGAMDD